MQALEDRLNQSEIGNQQPPNQIACYTPESLYYTLHQLESGIPPTINVLPPDQNQWTEQATFQQHGQHPRKRVRNRSQKGVRQPFQFSHSPNIAYQHQASPHTRHRNSWAAVVAAYDSAKEEAEEEETCRRPTQTKSNDSTISTIVLHVDMMCITPETHAQLPILNIICSTYRVTRHTCMPTR